MIQENTKGKNPNNRSRLTGALVTDFLKSLTLLRESQDRLGSLTDNQKL